MNYLVEIIVDGDVVDNAVFTDKQLRYRFVRQLRAHNIRYKPSETNRVFPSDTLITSENFGHMVEIYLIAWS